MQRFGGRWTAAAWCLLATIVCGPAAADTARLRVMLTNDDGYQAAGLVVLRAALERAGFEVTVVAPLAQQSGSGVRLTLGEIAVEDHGHRTWSVDGSPADSAAYGLTQVFAAQRPDIVVSGANLGQNLGANVVSSGTVGAAVMAVQLGVPAVAVSVGLDLAEAKARPTPFPSTVAAYPLAAEFVVRVLQRLAQAAEGGPLLPANTVLNLNVPARPAERIRGVRLAPLGRHGGFRMAYPPASEAGRVHSSLDIDTEGELELDADTGWFARGYITVSVLRPDWNADAASAADLAPRLGELERLRLPP